MSKKVPKRTAAAKAAEPRNKTRTALAAYARRARAHLEGCGEDPQNGAGQPTLRPNAALLTKREVIEITGLSYATLWRHIQLGQFPHGRICFGTTRWLRSEIDAWLAGLQPRELKADRRRAQEEKEKRDTS